MCDGRYPQAARFGIDVMIGIDITYAIAITNRDYY
jgi:hypothetical protein